MIVWVTFRKKYRSRIKPGLTDYYLDYNNWCLNKGSLWNQVVTCLEYEFQQISRTNFNVC